MAIPRVLVVYKRVAYQHRRHPDAGDARRAREVHEGAIRSVVRTLRRFPVACDVAYRGDLSVTKRYDLVVSLGGDGTFLQAASRACPGSSRGGRSFSRGGRRSASPPILGVNTDPSRSEAVFCAATVRTFAALFRRALAGRLPGLQLYRLEISLNGRRLPHRALNDILVVHDNPATMSRYRLHLGGRAEPQKSSGLWVSTAAGSSSAMLAAGGRRLPWSARQFQYRPRELYRGRLSHPALTGGVLSARTRLRVTWLMRTGSVFVDGPHLRIPLRLADRLDVRLSLTDPVRVLGLAKTHDP